MLNHFLIDNNPDYVFLAAAKVGGIHANDSLSGEFIYENIMIQNNVINSAYEWFKKIIISWFFMYLSQRANNTYN